MPVKNLKAHVKAQEDRCQEHGIERLEAVGQPIRRLLPPQMAADVRKSAPASKAVHSLRALIEADLAELTGKSHAEKLEIKKQRIPAYRDALESWKKGDEIDGLVLSVAVVWLFDLAEIGEFIELAGLAQTRGPLFCHPKFSDKDWRTMRLWLVHDWAYKQRDQRESWEPYVSELYAAELDKVDSLPDSLRDGLDYLVFYGLALAGKFEQAAKFGRGLFDAGRKPSIKGALAKLEKMIEANKTPEFQFAEGQKLDFVAAV